MSKPKLLVVGLGGTWCMAKRPSDNAEGEEVLAAEELGIAFDFGAHFPSVEGFCDVDFVEREALDSSNLTPAHWQQLAEFIADSHEGYDGIVVLQGTDTLSYTAAALSFALRGLGKPVVLSGAQLSMYEPASDAPSNVVNACRVAALREGSESETMAVREVVVVFGSRIIRGTRCRKYSERDLEAFDSINVPPLGRIRTKIRLDAGMVWRQQSNGAFVAATEFDEGVALVHLYPGLSPDLMRAIGKQSTGVVLAAYGAGNIPCSTPQDVNAYALAPVIADLVAAGIPVALTTQCVTGQAELQGKYETGDAARQAGAITLNDMLPECAFVKLSWTLRNSKRWPRDARRAHRKGLGRMEAIRKAMYSNLVGEVTDNQVMRSIYGP